ncbi:MAG: serine hydrolase domain-containing protein [Pacificimonas sp.]|jgi:CubicO group peptidase (beta-lactamase class C family)|nr:serine hydrolase domain-containing protein [Pacificimonas sp.]
MTMMKRLVGLAALGMATAMTPVAVSAQVQAPAAAQAEMPTPFVSLQELASRYVAENKVANMVIGVGIPGGMTFWVDDGTLAMGGTTEADEQSIYRIYSMTKPVIGIAAALLIEDGTIGLDQPLSDFYPEFAEMHVLSDPDTPGATVAAKNAITIRHLLTHTAGLGYSIIPSGIADLYREQGIVPGQRRPNPMSPSGEQPADLDEFMQRLAALPLRNEPGTEWSYSISLDVMGAVIEKAARMPLEEFLETRVFQPLGMDDTGFVVPEEDLDRLTTNYFMFNGNMMPIDGPADSEYAEAPPFPSGGGGLASTAEDYMRFLTALANGGMVGGQQALPAGAVELATSNILPSEAEFQLSFGITEASGPSQGYGAGGFVITDASGPLPVGTFGWGGAAGTLAYANPASRSAIVMMTQYMPLGAYPLSQELGAALAADTARLMGGANDN